MIVLIGSEKGGTGKTTLATNLAAMRAVEGGDVMLLDADSQGSATYWNQARDEAEIQPAVFCAQKFGRLDREVDKLAGKFDHLIIDAGGRDSEELRSAMLVAERFYIPILPSQFDLWTLNPMITLLGKAMTLNPALKPFIVFNRVSTNPTVTETEEASEILAEIQELALSTALIRDRIAFRKAVREGRSVTEIKSRDPKAVSEITTLYQEIYHG